MNVFTETISSHPGVVMAATHERPRWYVVATYPRHEKAVSERLEAKSIEAFLPLFHLSSRWKDRLAHLKSPLFPGYVFVRIGLSERNRVYAVPGVVRILSFNGKPAPVEDSEIEAVKICLERGATIEPQSFFGIGDRVRVHSGLLEGLEGVISRCKRERRLIVPISLINQSIAVEVDTDLLEPLDVLPGQRPI